MTKLHYIAFTGCLFLVSCAAINEKLGWTVEEEIEVAEEVVETVVQVETGYRPKL